MFGLSRYEKRLKAEQELAATLTTFVASLVQSVADVRVAEIKADADRLREENEKLKAALAAREEHDAHR